MVNFVFFSLVQKVNCFISIANPKLMLINQGAAPEPASLVEYDQFLERFVDRPKAFIERIEGLLQNIRDYKGRPFRLFDPASDDMKSLGHLSYDALLARFNYADTLDLDDLLFRKFYPRITGIITKAWQTSITSNAIHPVPIVSAGALTPSRQLLLDYKIKNEAIGIRKSELYNDLLENGKDILHDSTLDSNLAAQLLLILTGASKQQMLDTVDIFRHMSMSDNGSTDPLLMKISKIFGEKK